METGLGNAVNLLLFNIGPSMVSAAVWAAVCALALRRWGVNTPGALPIAVGSGLVAVAHLLNTAWPLVIVFDEGGAGEMFEHPVFEAISVAAVVVTFVAPPLMLWGLWLTWRSYDRTAAGETP